MKSDTFEDIISLNEDIDYVTEHKRIKKYWYTRWNGILNTLKHQWSGVNPIIPFLTPEFP